MVEYFFGIVKNKKNKCVYINCLFDVTPTCDCHKEQKPAIVDDIGIVVSLDPIAIDQASVDLLNREAGYEGTDLKGGIKSGGDKIKGVYPWIDWSIQLDYGQALGLGTRDYKLVELKAPE
jgi:uncharacterized Fe-S center protein